MTLSFSSTLIHSHPLSHTHTHPHTHIHTRTSTLPHTVTVTVTVTHYHIVTQSHTDILSVEPTHTETVGEHG